MGAEDHNSFEAAQKVWVGNLPAEATSEDLDAHFRQLGAPLLCVLLRKGVGVVAYGSAEEADTSISAFNGSEIGGMAIKTDSWAAKQGKGKEGKGGKAVGKGKDGKGQGCGFGKGAGWGWGPMGMGMGWGGWGMDPWMMGKAAMWMKGGGKDKGGGWDEDKSHTFSSNQRVTCYAITVDASSAIPAQGMPTDAPALAYEKGVDVFGSGAHILGELVGDIATEVLITHDADWETYPEVGAAVKAASGEENCFAIAMCPSAGVWGIGVANGWKGREASCKVALALAICRANAPAAKSLGNRYPEFTALLRQQGVKGGKAAGGGGGGASYGGMSGDTPPVHMISVPADSVIVAGGLGLPAEGPAVMHPGKHMKEYFSNAHSILSELVEDVAAEVVFEDDPDAKALPEVAAAWAEAGGEENCFCIAKCTSLGCWGVGLAPGWKGRESAAKMALAIAIAQNMGKLEELSANPNYPEFGYMLSKNGIGDGQPKKKRKV
mmetsp:Transcript_25431/g.72627  ORF Transcript_25431/g.72627 Transcript_25431/m.72627 type:complete len:492 (-) Transcript_25431:180-1655(-)